MTRAYFAGMVLVAVAVTVVAGVIVNFHLWGDGTTAATGGVNYSAPTTAFDIANRAAEQQRLANSVHLLATTTLISGGTTLKTTRDAQFDRDTIYEKVQTLGIKQEVLQVHGRTCIRQNGGSWKAQVLPARSTVSETSRLLDEIVAPPYTNLQRIADVTLPDGRQMYVLTAEGDGSDYQGQLSDITLPGAEVMVDSVSVQVMIDKATWLLTTEKLDISFHTGSTAGHETVDGTIDRFNQPASFPPDLPQSCAGGSA